MAGETEIAEYPIGVGPLGLQPHARRRHRSTRALDWISFALAILVPPLGLVVAIVAVLVGVARNGWASAVAKVALAIAVALSLVVAGFGIVGGAAFARQQAFDAVVSSSAKFCAKVDTLPGRMQSSTFGWPSPAATVEASLPAMKAYSTLWSEAASVAPSAIRAGTKSLATEASSIEASVATTRTLDDAANVARMQQVASASGVGNWVVTYCKR